MLILKDLKIGNNILNAIRVNIAKKYIYCKIHIICIENMIATSKSDGKNQLLYTIPKYIKKYIKPLKNTDEATLYSFSI